MEISTINNLDVVGTKSVKSISERDKPDLSIYYRTEKFEKVVSKNLNNDFSNNNEMKDGSIKANEPGVIYNFQKYDGGSRKYDHIIEEMSEKYSIDKDLIRMVMKTESNFNPDLVSHAGAAGLMQLMPITAKVTGTVNRFDPRQNIEGGVKYLRMMLDQHDGDLKLALASYNAGPGNVKKYGGVPPFKETQNYIKKILG